MTHESNKQYYLDILFYPAPRTLQPDRMALFNPMYWISRRPRADRDGGRRAAQHRASTSSPTASGSWKSSTCRTWRTSWAIRRYAQGNHSVDMLMAYLPKEKILLQRRSLLAAGAGRGAAGADSRHADAASEHPEAEARRRAARARARTRRHARRVHAACRRNGGVDCQGQLVNQNDY